MGVKGQLWLAIKSMDPTRALVIACATVIEQMLPLMPEGMDTRIFDFS
jgi:hypothetical protein